MPKKSTEQKWSTGRFRRVTESRLETAVRSVALAAKIDLQKAKLVEKGSLPQKIAREIALLLGGELITLYKEEVAKKPPSLPLQTDDIIAIAMNKNKIPTT